MNKLAVGIRSFNTPHYLKEALASLENNADLRTADFFLYQDGSSNPFSGATYAEEEDIEACVKLFNDSELPNKHIVRNAINRGAGYNRIRLFQDLFEDYEYVVSVDNDLVFSKYYIRTLNTLFEQFEDSEEIGMVQTSLRDYRDVPHYTRKQAARWEAQVQYGFSRRWEQGIWRRSWEEVEPMLGTLIEKVGICDFKELLDRKNPLLSKQRAELLETYATFHVDQAIENCMLQTGLQGICTRAPRHKGIGKHGFYTFTPTVWEEAGLDKAAVHDIGAHVGEFDVFNNDLCIAIRTMKRADYLKEMLDSFERNTKLGNVDFYFYIDGTVNPFSGEEYATEGEVNECLSVIQNACLPNKIIHIEPENTQTAIQKYKMLTTLFPRYRYVMMMDNDLVVNKYYVKSIKTLFKQFEDDPKAGMLQTFYVPPRHRAKKTPPTEELEGLANRVQYGFSRRWEQGFWRDSWERIRPRYEEYMDFVEDCDYKQLLDNHPSLHKVRDRLLKRFPAPNADLVLETIAYRLGYLGIHTMVPRHKGIGVFGMYSFKGEDFWKEQGLDKVELFDIGNVNRFFFRAKMNFAEDFQDLFEDEDVYIAGSGPSLDTYPDGFFDDRLGITLHLAYLKFPDAAYRGVCESPIIRWMSEYRPEFFEKKSIFTYPFHPNDYPQMYLGDDLGKSQGWPAPIFVRYVEDYSFLQGTTYEELIAKAIKGEPVIAGAFSSVLHSILFAALTMGAKKIHLIGCDHAKKDGQTYFSVAEEIEDEGKNKLRLRYRRDSWYRPEMCERQRYGTNKFVAECRKHGIIIERYADYDDWCRKNE